MTAASLGNHPDAALQLEGVRFGWAAGKPVVDIDRLDIARGERVLIQGASGSGKTTLLSLLAGVLVPQAGSIRVAGTNLSSLPGAARDRFRSDHIGFVFQQFNLLPYLSVRENVLLPRAFSARRTSLAEPGQADILLEQLGLNMQSLGDRPVTSLSIGQQQRVAVARALIGTPELLIADEPTSALDADAREAFLHLVFAECERAGSTLVLVSHDAGLVPLFDRALRLAEINRVPAMKSL